MPKSRILVIDDEAAIRDSLKMTLEYEGYDFVAATKKGAFDFIEKPFASDRVLVSLRNALDQRRLRDENRSLKKAVEVRHQMIGESPALRQVTAAIARAAPTNATDLIQGESGVGKELVARTIHRNSLRSRERFVQVNCAAIP